MKITSIEKVNKKYIEGTLNLDVDLIENVERDTDDGMLEIRYNSLGIGCGARFPFQPLTMRMYAKLTRNDVYMTAHMEFADDEAYLDYLEYSAGSSGIDFDVVLNPEEKTRLLIYLLNLK